MLRCVINVKTARARVSGQTNVALFPACFINHGQCHRYAMARNMLLSITSECNSKSFQSYLHSLRDSACFSSFFNTFSHSNSATILASYLNSHFFQSIVLCGKARGCVNYVGPLVRWPFFSGLYIYFLSSVTLLLSLQFIRRKNLGIILLLYDLSFFTLCV